MYGTNEHDNYSRRLKNLMRQIWADKNEAIKLTAIYEAEAAFGANSNYVSNSIATKQEMIDAQVCLASFKALIDGSGSISQTDRTSNFTPFLASE